MMFARRRGLASAGAPRGVALWLSGAVPLHRVKKLSFQNQNDNPSIETGETFLQAIHRASSYLSFW
jgi:hypothetical protein